jgi:oxalate decarboxylase/phosphoglucose isomerase-like protein (cupin superfamily)
MQPLALPSLLLAAVFSVSAQLADPKASAELAAKLLTVPTQVQRMALLNDSDFVFNFNAGVGVGKGAGGSVTTANAVDFPAVIGNGMAMAVGLMEPCGFNTPHTHPRAAEFLYVINGTGIQVGFIEENGARYVTNNVMPGEATLFPKGSIHFQVNLGCEPLQFVAGLNNIDPGVLSVAQRFFGLPVDVVAATLGEIGVEEVVGLAQGIPDSFALGIQQCLDTCKITRGTQPTSQLQPRVSSNAFPSNSSSNSTQSGTARKRSVPRDDAVPTTLALQLNTASINDLIFMLRIVVGVMLFGYVAIGVGFVLRRRRTASVELRNDEYSPGHHPVKI